MDIMSVGAQLGKLDRAITSGGSKLTSSAAKTTEKEPSRTENPSKAEPSSGEPKTGADPTIKEREQPQSTEETKNGAYARMYHETQKKAPRNVVKDDVVSHEDIDYYWDNPKARVGRSSDILGMIQKEIGGRNTANEWNPDPELEERTAAGSESNNKTREPLFPKTQPRKEPDSAALQDCNELESLFANEQLRNSKSFKELIE